MILKSEYGNLIVNTDNAREIEHLRSLGFKEVEKKSTPKRNAKESTKNKV